MIRPPLAQGAAFSEAREGDIRGDNAARSSFSEALGISDRWATVHQVHGSHVVRVSDPGTAGDGDALWTTEPGLPVAIFTADCFGTVLIADEAVGVAHAGWRGVASGVVAALRSEMTVSGHEPTVAAIGPGIRRCCFEVGPAVTEQFPDDAAKTSWDTPSVDLESAIANQLDGIDVFVAHRCTHHEEGWFSHRATGTTHRLASVGWLE